MPHSARFDRTSAGPIAAPPIRRGVTVLEVLISIGVAAIGLLGVILLIPLADHQMNRGLVLERANQVGANAFREFEIIGASNPNLWRQLLAVAPGVTQPALVGPDPTSGQIEVRRAFCLDPAFVATNGSTIGPNNEDPTVFPYTDPSAVPFNMARITLPAFPGGALSTANLMNFAQADSIFTSHDDLEFRRPTGDRTLPPVQLNNEGTDWIPSGTPGVDQLVRQARGRMSWMATVVPQEKVGPNGDEYVLSIVVFHQRDGSYSMTPAGDESANERVAQVRHDPINGVSGFMSVGVGGGQVALIPRSTGLSQAVAERELDVKAGDWVMLSRRNRYIKGYDNSTGTPTPIYGDAPHTHRWYRVVAADPEIVQAPTGANYAPSGSWVRFVTLDGPDYTPQEFPGVNQVTIVKNVAAVFEKTVRLETSSLWMQ